MKCEDIQTLLPDYWAGGLPAQSKADVEAHVAVCTSCQQDSALWTTLGQLPQEQPSAALAVRFREIAAAYREGRDQERGAVEAGERRYWLSWRLEEWITSWWPVRPVLQIGLAALALLIGAGLGSGWKVSSRPSGEMSELREELRRTRELMTVSLLRQQSASDRLRGVNWTYRIQRPDETVLDALVDALRYDSAVDVRLAATDALRRYPDHADVRKGLVAALEEERSPLVQAALIDAVSEMKESAAGPVLERLARDPQTHTAVRLRAERARKAVN